MFLRCPKCNTANVPGADERCPACGLIYAKYLQAQQGKLVREAAAGIAPVRAAALARLLQVPARVERPAVYGRLAAYAFAFVWGWRLYAMDLDAAEIMNSFMHLIVLPIHEAGHLLFIAQLPLSRGILIPPIQ